MNVGYFRKFFYQFRRRIIYRKADVILYRVGEKITFLRNITNEFSVKFQIVFF